MEPQEYNSSVNWLVQLLALIDNKEYDEAFTLAEYFPPTQGRRVLQFVALLGQGNYKEAEILLKQLKLEPHADNSDLKSLIHKANLDLLEIAGKATEKGFFSLAFFCLEFFRSLHPGATQNILDPMLLLTSQALISGNLALGHECFQQLLNLDQSPARLIQYAEIALANRRTNSSESLSRFAEDLIHRALSETPASDLEMRLKIAKLLAIEIRTFSEARELLGRMVQADSRMIPRVFHLLSPLIEYKPYFSEIADFLLTIAPEKIDLIVVRLLNGRKLQRNAALFEKAQAVLEAFHYAGHSYDLPLAKSLMLLVRDADRFETYAQRLMELEAPPDIFLEAAQILLSRYTKEHALVSGLLERTLYLNPSARQDVLSSYGRLRYLAESYGQAELSGKLLERVIDLSTELSEFLERGINISLAHQLFFINKNEARFSKARWYKRDELDKLTSELINSSSSYERQEALKEILKKHTEFDLERLTKWLNALFQVDLGLTPRMVTAIQEISSRTAPEVQRLVNEGLEKQDISPDRLDRLAAYRQSGDRYSIVYDSMDTALLREYALDGWNLDAEMGWSGVFIKSADMLPPKGKGAGKPRKRIERHTRVDFPVQCVLEKKVELRIQLTKSAPKKTRVREKLEFDVEPEVKKLRLDINVTAPQFAIQERKKQMLMSVDEDSEDVTFTLVPLELGDQVVEVEIFYESVRVGYLLVKTHVREQYGNDSPANVLVMETPSRALKSIAGSRINPDRRILHSTWFEKEGKLSYTVYSPDINESPEWETLGPNLKGEVEDYLRQLNAFLNEVVVQGNPSDEDWNSMLLNLQGIGSDLYAKLIPAPLAAQLRDWKPGSLVVISTNEQWIPWELIYDETDFWGKKFIIARLPRLSDRRSAPDRGRPEKKAPRSIKRIVNVVGGEVGAADAKRACGLFSTLTSPVQVEILQEKSVAELKIALPKTDVLHCTCHGHLEPYMLQVAKDKTIITNLLPQTIHQLPLEPGSFVFANTCTSALPVLTFGRFSSFAWEFYRRGAGAFVGTLGAVPTSHAVCFAETIYKELFSKRSQRTIGQAVNIAKDTAANERNLFWLLYCIYGDPDYRLKVSLRRRK